MSLYLGGIARESFLSSSVCVLARRVSTRVHAARELSHTCRIPILGKLSSRTLLRYVHQTKRRATLKLANVMHNATISITLHLLLLICFMYEKYYINNNNRLIILTIKWKNWQIKVKEQVLMRKLVIIKF